MIKGESKDPIAGEHLRKTVKRSTGICIRQDAHQQLKMLSVIENRRFNSYVEEAIDDFLVKIADRLPKIT